MIEIPDIKNKYIGARFTPQEKKEFEKLIKEKDLSLSKFVREALFSHYNFLKKHDGKLEKIKVYVIKEV